MANHTINKKIKTPAKAVPQGQLQDKGVFIMDNKNILKRLSGFDPDLYEIVSEELTRQHDTLSFIPTAQAATPFSSYIKGSALGNELVDHHTVRNHTRLEELACQRAAELYGADHAIVRLGSLDTASRVVFFAMAKKGDTILSFNGRKSEYCTGDSLSFNFVNYSIDPKLDAIDLDEVEQLTQQHQPKMIIYSPVNAPRCTDFHRLARIAHNAGAVLWVDMGQNAGLVATGTLKSPVPHADVVTFPAYVLHGPQNGIILCRSKYAAILDKTVHRTGHDSLKKNVLAALAITFREAKTEEFHSYCQQVIANARALERSLQAEGLRCHGAETENHLVLPELPSNTDLEDITRTFADASILVKAETLQTNQSDVNIPILRLSSIDPTTRSLKEKDMEKLGHIIGRLLLSPQDNAAIKETRQEIKRIVSGLPIFSEEWLPDSEITRQSASDSLQMLMHFN